jgi:4-oxalocrotonate tautomerase
MPLVRIDLPETSSSVEISSISNAIHAAMVKSFNVPDTDRFQIISKHSQDEIICSENFLDVKHSNHVVFVQITCAPGRTTEMKKSLYALIVSNIAKETSFSANDVIINLVETHRENWSFGNGIAQYAT